MKHPFDVHVGKRIQQNRCRAGLTEHEFGVMLGVPTVQIMAVEAGAVRVEPELMRQVVDVLDVPAAALFDGLASALSAAA